MILASDGVWEFMTSDTVVKAATSTLQGQGLKKTTQDLYEAALQCWRNAETDYCDDITAVIVQGHFGIDGFSASGTFESSI